MLPAEFLEEMQSLLGEEFEAFLASMEQKPYKALRINPLKCKVDFLQDYFTLTPVAWEKDGYYFSEEEKPGAHPFHEAGLFYIQEPSAMAPVPFLQIKPGERVLDLCAAPGGKSTQIAGYLGGEGLLISNEIHPARAQILSENIERMGIGNAIVTNEAPERLSKYFTGFFDKILVDAPCSGEGMFRKNEEAALQWSKEVVEMCAKRQDEVLHEAAKMLRPGGKLVYSTCTFSTLENEGSISRFLETHPDFFVEETKRMMPHKIKGEGHFMALLARRGENTAQSLMPPCGLEKGIRIEDCKEFTAFAKENLRDDARMRITKGRVFIRFGDNLYAAPAGCPALTGLKVARPGLHLGTVKNKRFEPSHALALYVTPQDVKNAIFLSVKEAAVRKYLSGQTLTIGEGLDVPNPVEKGYALIAADGCSIGWGKVAGGLVKNHYPKGLRKM